jgi:hypothetical protein
VENESSDWNRLRRRGTKTEEGCGIVCETDSAAHSSDSFPKVRLYACTSDLVARLERHHLGRAIATLGLQGPAQAYGRVLRGRMPGAEEFLLPH